MHLQDNQTRLFFSINLVNSTSFKQEEQKLGHKWQADFLQFYFDFPDCLQSARNKYVAKWKGHLGAEIPEFNFWKAVGDELLFVCSISDYRQVKIAVDIWLEAQNSYENDILKPAANKFDKSETNNDGTDIARAAGSHKITQTRGAVFSATFNDPDTVVAIPTGLVDRHEDGGHAPNNREIIKNIDIAREQEKASSGKYVIDYIGPSIDIGFHIISKSTAEFFTMSMEVAWCYSLSCIFNRDGNRALKMLGQTRLKGVWDGRYYPIFAKNRGPDDRVANVLLMRNEDVISICGAYYECDDWPSKLYLPDSPEIDNYKKPISLMKIEPDGLVVDPESVENSETDIKGLPTADKLRDKPSTIEQQTIRTIIEDLRKPPLSE